MREFDYECKNCGCETTQFEDRDNGGLCDTCVKKKKNAQAKKAGFTALFCESEEERAVRKARELLFGKKDE